MPVFNNFKTDGKFLITVVSNSEYADRFWKRKKVKNLEEDKKAKIDTSNFTARELKKYEEEQLLMAKQIENQLIEKYRIQSFFTK